MVPDLLQFFESIPAENQSVLNIEVTAREHILHLDYFPAIAAQRSHILNWLSEATPPPTPTYLSLHNPCPLHLCSIYHTSET